MGCLIEIPQKIPTRILYPPWSSQRDITKTEVTKSPLDSRRLSPNAVFTPSFLIRYVGAVVSGTMASVFGLHGPWWNYSMTSGAILGYSKIDLAARLLRGCLYTLSIWSMVVEWGRQDAPPRCMSWKILPPLFMACSTTFSG